MEQFTIRVVMEGGSAGIRSYLEDHGFDIYRTSLISKRFDNNHPSAIRLDENGRIDDGATFTAFWCDNRPHPEEDAVLKKIRSHPSVAECESSFERIEFERATDDVPG